MFSRWPGTLGAFTSGSLRLFLGIEDKCKEDNEHGPARGLVLLKGSVPGPGPGFL